MPWATQLVEDEAQVDSRWLNSRAYALNSSKRCLKQKQTVFQEEHKTPATPRSQLSKQRAPKSCTEGLVFWGYFCLPSADAKNGSVDKYLRVRASSFLSSEIPGTWSLFPILPPTPRNLQQYLHASENVSLRHTFTVKFKGHYKLSI